MSTNINNLGQSSSATAVNTNVILQTLKRRATKASIPLDKVVNLEKVLGFTITSNLKLAQCHDGTVAYLAGCVIVLYDTRLYKQDFIVSPARKALTTLCFSADGRVIATGESGHDPKLRIWDKESKVQIAEFPGHKFSIDCVCFSPNLNSNIIISIGSVHDMGVNVWNYKTKFKVASNKIACKVKGISFSKDGSYFVTVGNRHVKFWYLTISTLLETVPLKGRAAILSDMKNCHFCDVVCGSSNCSHLTFSITSNGVLCEFDENRTLRKVIELRVDRAYSIYADDDNLYIGCSSATILIFRQKNLEFIASLPHPHNLGVDISKGLDTRHLIENLNNCDLKYPDCIALCYNPFDYYLCAIYNDHSLYIWDIRDVNKVKKVDSHLFHSSCCWGLDTFSNQTSNSGESFITCSSDNTVRIWSLENLNNDKSSNIYSKELMKIIYIDNELSALCDNTESNNGNQQDENIGSCNTHSTNGTSSNKQEIDQQLNSIKLGARCLKISPFGSHLATGDRNGNIRIYDLKHLESIIMIEAHESEVLYLQYSPPESGRLLLASSSRDRLIHIFDARRNYELTQTIDDHSAAITATRFCYNQIEKQFYLISCGSDKSIIFRCAHETPNSQQQPFNDNLSKSNNFFEINNQNSSKIQFSRSSYVCEKMTFYDLVIDPTKNYVNTVSQDRIIRTYSIKDGKKLRQFKGSLNEDGYLLKMDIDRSGTLLATSCTDKCVYIWDLNTCECLAYLCGHSELIVDLKFTYDNKYLITVGVDSCIFVWNLSTLSTYSQQHSVNTHIIHRKSQLYNTNNLISSKGSADDFAFDFLLDHHHLSHPHSEFQNSKNKIEKCQSYEFNKVKYDLFSEQKHSDSESVHNFDVTKNSNVRRSRAVWGPVCNTSFAIMVDNEIEENCIDESKASIKSHEAVNGNFANIIASEVSLPAVQFPSPSIEKNLYQVVTVATENNSFKSKSLCLTIEDAKEDDLQDSPCTPTKDTFSEYPTSKSACSDILFNQIITPNLLENDNRFLNLSNSDSLIQRRQSLSARYLSKAQKSDIDLPPENEVHEDISENSKEQITESVTSPTILNKQCNNYFPSITSANNNLSSAQITADLLKAKKNKTANCLHSMHTESSLNKVKSKQQLTQPDIPNSRFNKSPSMNSVISLMECLNTSEDKIGAATMKNLNDDDAKYNDKPSPANLLNGESDVVNGPTTDNDNTSTDSNSSANLKKASSMISLNSVTVPVPVISSSSSFSARPITSVNINTNRSTSVNSQNNNLNKMIATNHQNVVNNNLPPKTVRQVKQKSTDRHQVTNQSCETNLKTNLEKSRSWKLSGSIQNLQSVQTIVTNTEPQPQPIRKPQRFAVCGKVGGRKQRANTEELMSIPKQNHENENNHKNINGSPHGDTNGHENILSPRSKFQQLEKSNQMDEESLWKEFNDNLALLDFINKKAKFENLTSVQKQQRKELLITFNKNTKSFISQIETISSEKKS